MNKVCRFCESDGVEANLECFFVGEFFAQNFGNGVGEYRKKGEKQQGDDWIDGDEEKKE